MVTWKDNFDSFYSEVAELGRYTLGARALSEGAAWRPASRHRWGSAGGHRGGRPVGSEGPAGGHSARFAEPSPAARVGL